MIVNDEIKIFKTCLHNISNKFFYRESIDFYRWIPCIAMKSIGKTFFYVYQLLAQWNSTQQQHSVKPLHLGQKLEEKNRKDSMATKLI